MDNGISLLPVVVFAPPIIESTPAYCARSGGGKSLAIASSGKEDQDANRKVIDHVRKTRAICSDQKQWEKTKRKGRCQRDACGET